MNLGGIFISRYCSDGKEMYKKSVIKCKFVFFQSKATSIALFPFSFLLLPSSWSLLKPPIVYKRVCFVKEVNKTNTFLFTSFTIPRKLDSQSRRCCCIVQKTVMYVLSCCFANLRPCPKSCVFKSMPFCCHRQRVD